jgi:hypothetical protein
MQAQSPESSVAGISPENGFGLRVSIIYEDLGAGLRAKHCLDRLSHDLDLEPGFFDLRLWSYGLLSEPELRSAAAREAGDFEIIVFSANGCEEPPAMVKEWLLEWLACRGQQPCALALLPDGPAGKLPGENSLLDYLSGIARGACLDLVYPFCETTRQPPDEAIRKIARQAINASPILENLVEHWGAYSHWGINE